MLDKIQVEWHAHLSPIIVYLYHNVYLLSSVSIFLVEFTFIKTILGLLHNKVYILFNSVDNVKGGTSMAMFQNSKGVTSHTYSAHFFFMKFKFYYIWTYEVCLAQFWLHNRVDIIP